MSSSTFTVVLLAASLFFITPFTAHGQPRHLELGVHEFLLRIDGKLPELARPMADIAAAEASAFEARSLAPLELNYEREEVFVGGEGVALKDAVTIGWSLDISGRRGKRIKSAELNTLAVRQQADHASRELTISALELYYQAARAGLQVAALESTREQLAILVERLGNQVRAGDASGYELSRFQLTLAEYDDQLDEARIERAIAQGQLAVLLGETAGTLVTASDSLELVGLDLLAAGAASSTRADLRATAFQGASGKALEEAAARWWIPVLKFSLGYLATDFGPGSGPGADVAHGYAGMISASIPIFSRGRADAKRGRARVLQAEAERSILERRVASELQSARSRLRLRLQQASRFRDHQLPLVAALVDKTEAAYQGGEAAARDLLEAYGKASAAKLRYIELRYQYTRARLALASATGVLDTGEWK